MPVWAVISAPVAGLSRTYILPLSVTGCEGARFAVAGGRFAEGGARGACEKYGGRGLNAPRFVIKAPDACVLFV